jgi:hypothetical protein
VQPPLAHLEHGFPKLAAAGYQKTSEQTGKPPNPGAYNCIAWAAEDPRNKYFWWPEGGDAYWPSWIKPREVTVVCFVKTFRWLGYRVCDNSRYEREYDKVVLYAIHGSGKPITPPKKVGDLTDWAPTHMARQLVDGTWTSKLGGNEDITHFTLDAIECYGPCYGPNWKNEYGCPVLYMRRRRLLSRMIRFIQLIQSKIEHALDDR